MDYTKLGDLRITLPPTKKSSLSNLQPEIRLKDVADLPDAAGGPNQINRENVRRRAVIRCNTQGRDLAGVVADIERLVPQRVPMPEGYFVEYGGQFEAQRSATLLIAVLAVVSVAGVFVVLYLLFPSLRISLQILNAVPTAFIGGVKITTTDDDHDHDEGPHGGTVIEFGKYHGEFVVDHTKKTATVYILDGKVKNAVPISASKLLLSIKTPQFQADLFAVPQDSDPKGKCSRFVATHENFAKKQEFEGTVSGEIDGKPYLGDFKEEEHKDPKHDKK